MQKSSSGGLVPMKLSASKKEARRTKATMEDRALRIAFFVSDHGYGHAARSGKLTRLLRATRLDKLLLILLHSHCHQGALGKRCKRYDSVFGGEVVF